jgi:hypothetical protein
MGSDRKLSHKVRRLKESLIRQEQTCPPLIFLYADQKPKIANIDATAIFSIRIITHFSPEVRSAAKYQSGVEKG